MDDVSFFFYTVDTDDPDTVMMSSPAKRPSSHFYMPPSSTSNFNNSSHHQVGTHITHHHQHHSNAYSISSCSSPDHPSDSNSNHGSCDEDSGSEPAFVSRLSSNSSTAHAVATHPLSCDTRHGSSSNGNSFAFVKPRYVAPQSPLAAGVNSHSAPTKEIRKSTLGPTSYTFTPVKERT